jgi:aminopeptidase N
MDFSDDTYRERLYGIFKHHEKAEDRNFDFFYQSQLLWDETMSWSIDEFLRKNPDYQMVVLAGRGHLEYGAGIPKRTFRRNGENYAIVLSDGPVDKDIADYVVYPNPLEGVVAPKLMVFISEEKEGIKITGFPEMSVTEKAGVKAGDIIISFDYKEMKTIDDVKIQLVYKKPGDTVRLEVLRKEKDEEKKMVFDVTL